jgi:SnoaL-like protein
MPPPRSPAPQPPAPFVRAWRHVVRNTDPRVLTSVAVGIAVVAVVVAVVFIAKGSGSGDRLAGVAPANANATETAAVESSPTETTPSPATVEAPQVEQLLDEYTQAYSAEDIEGMKNLFAESLERHDGSRSPEDLSAAIATYEKQFGELEKPSYSLSETSVEPGAGEATATSQYSITSQNGTVTGSITFHFTELEEKLLIDRLTIEPAA